MASFNGTFEERLVWNGLLRNALPRRSLYWEKDPKVFDSRRSVLLLGYIQLNLVRAYGVITRVEFSGDDVEEKAHWPQSRELVFIVGLKEGKRDPRDDLPESIAHGGPASKEQSGRPGSTGNAA